MEPTTLTVAIAVAPDVAVSVALYQYGLGFGWASLIFLPLIAAVYVCFAVVKSTMQ